MANSRNYSNMLNGNINVIGKKIQKYRKSKNLSKQALSNKLILLGIDISAKSIYHIEAGTRTVVDFEICALAKVLNISVEELLNDFYNSLDNI